MSATNVAVILAAGNGSRLRSVSGSVPKPLVEVGTKPLLEHVILSAQVAGIDRFLIVVGYGNEAITSWITRRRFSGTQIHIVENPDYMKANGVSLLQVRDFVDSPFLLLMSDHLFEPRTAANLVSQPLGSGEAILAVDYKLDSIFDMDDATKVACAGGRVLHIGKDLVRYNAVDTGMFLCTPAIFNALERSIVDGNCSLSDGMRVLAQRNRLRAFDVRDAVWQDVDTPEALEFASRVFPKIYRPIEMEAVCV